MYILKKKRGYEENIPGGDSVPPAEKNSIQLGIPERGHEQSPAREMPQEIMETRPSPGIELSPEGNLPTSPARRVGLRRPLFRRGHLRLCVAGVPRSRGRGGSGGGQEHPVLKSMLKPTWF